MTSDDDGSSGRLQGAVSGSADPAPGRASHLGDHEGGRFDAGDFVVDHDVDPPEEVQPTTTA
jgi:hypothetical protein